MYGTSMRLLPDLCTESNLIQITVLFVSVNFTSPMLWRLAAVSLCTQAQIFLVDYLTPRLRRFGQGAKDTPLVRILPRYG